MKILLFAILSATTAFAAGKKPVSADDLLAQTILHPGSFNQICDAPEPIDPAIPLPIYRNILEREVNLSGDKLKALQTRRAEVVPALNKLLASIDPTKPALKVPPMKLKDTPEGDMSEEVEASGISPKQLSGLIFEIVRGLNAVETLPELLNLEERLRAALEKAGSDPKVAPPSVAQDGSVVFPAGSAKLSKRDEKMALGRVAQRELLSLMLELLRKQRFQPLLDSDFEKNYAKAIKERAAGDEDLRNLKPPADGSNKNADGLEFDPIYGVALGYMRVNPSVPFSREVREKVRGLVKAYLDAAPEAKKGDGAK